MNDSALRDIIPCDDVESIKKARNRKCSRICKVFMVTICLGFISFGIVALVIILGNSCRPLVNCLIQWSTKHQLLLPNETQNLKSDQQKQDPTTLGNGNSFTKIPFTSANYNKPNHSSTLTDEIKHEIEHLSTSTQFIKSYPSSNTIFDELLTSSSIKTEMSNQELILATTITNKNQEYVETSQQNSILIENTPLLSTFHVSRIQDHEMAISEKIPSSISNDLQSTTSSNMKKVI